MQCDLHRNREDATGQTPYLLDIRANLLSDLQSRVVVPLVPREGFGRPITRLHPVFSIENRAVVMVTHLAAAVRRSSLGKVVVSLRDDREAIPNAVDVLWSGV